jgi:hypothetical protein
LVCYDGRNVTSTIALAHLISKICILFATGDYNVLGCLIGDGVPDTPAERVFRFEKEGKSFDGRRDPGCPGLLPYDRDRDLFGDPISTSAVGNCSNLQPDRTCPDQSCAACCNRLQQPGGECPSKLGDDLNSVTEDIVNVPNCCRNNEPKDTCPLRRGYDPKNNYMSVSFMKWVPACRSCLPFTDALFFLFPGCA